MVKTTSPVSVPSSVGLATLVSTSPMANVPAVIAAVLSAQVPPIQFAVLVLQGVN